MTRNRPGYFGRAAPMKATPPHFPPAPPPGAYHEKEMNAMHKIKLDPLPIVTGDPDELLDLDIFDTCEFATTQAARIAAICEQVKRYTVTRYIAPGRQIIVAPSTRTPGGWQVTFYHADRQTGELVPIGHADRDTAAGVADEIPYNYIAADAVA